MLVSIVLQHWNLFLRGPLNRLDSISHDNSFLPFHPFEFEQRTMLAMFLMNKTQLKTVHFIQKPVYARFIMFMSMLLQCKTYIAVNIANIFCYFSLGMLSSLARMASEMEKRKNVSYILSIGELYSAVLLFSTQESQYSNIEIKFKIWPNATNATFGYFAEFLDRTRTNPYELWKKFGKPAYPNDTVLNEMTHAQVRFVSISN